MSNSDFAVFGAFIIFYIVMMLFALAVYLFDSIVTAIYAKKHGVRNYGVAFLPIGREYVLGSLAQQYAPEKKSKTTFMGLAIAYYSSMILISIAACAISVFATFNNISDESFGILVFIFVLAVYVLILGLAIAYIVYSFIVAYRIFTYKAGENGIIWLIVNILLSTLVMPIFMLVYMNKPGIPKNASFPTGEIVISE